MSARRSSLIGLCTLTAATLSPGPSLAAPGDFAEPEVELRWSRAGEPGSSYGWAIADVADVNGDGATDLAVGAPYALGPEGNAGRLELLSGLDGEPLWSVDGTGNDLLGYAMADAGDVDDDGVTDVIIGAPGAEGGGRAEVRSGVDGELLLSLPSPDPGAFFGGAVAGAHLDEDTFADLVVGGPRATSEGGTPGDQGGAVWGISGADGQTVWVVHAQPGAHLGSGVSNVGDLDDDGLDDPFVGARDGGDDGRGWARVLSGLDGATVLELAPDPLGGDFGWFFVAGVGDIDGDQLVDLYVGDFASNVAGAGSGRVHVYSGGSGAPLLTIPGAGPGEGLGCGRGAGDVDADGIPDLLTGAYSSSAGASQAGRVFVFSGADGQILRTITSLETNEQLGFDAVGLGDVDNDGDPELALAAAQGDHVYLIDGLGGSNGDGDGDTETGDGDTTDSEAGDGETTSSAPPGGETTSASQDANANACGCDERQDDTPPFSFLALVAIALFRRLRRPPELAQSRRRTL